MEEKWFEILEISNKEEEFLEYLKNEFNKNNMKYQIDLKEEWKGIRVPQYIGKYIISIQEKDKLKVEKMIHQYYENNIAMGREKQTIEADNEEEERECRKIQQRQKRMKRILAIVILGMIISIVIAGIIMS